MNRTIAAVTACVLVSALAAARSQGQEPASGKDIPQWVERIEKTAPGVIFVGSSIQGEGLDFSAISRALDTPAMDARSGGSMSPWHYCFLRFIVPAASHKPRLVVVETRMNFLSCPQKRMRWDAYKRAVESIAGGDRSLLERLAYSSEGRPEWKYAYDQEAGPPLDGFYWDFNASVEHTFLPEFIRLAKEGGYKLVIARHKSRQHAEEPQQQPPEARKYTEDMAAWLQAQQVVFLDYIDSPQIKPEHYANGDHLRRDTGRPIMTALMIEDLKAVLAGEQPPRQRVAADKPAEPAAAPAPAEPTGPTR